MKDRALRIRDVAKRTAEGIIQIGQWLTEAKARIPHGGWLPWLESEFGWSVDTAQRFMRVHELCKNRTVRNLEIDVSTLYLIAAPKTPEPVRQEILKRAEAGEPMTKAKAVEVLESYKAQTELETDPVLDDMIARMIARYEAMVKAVDEAHRCAEDFIENATIDDLPTLAKLASNEPERALMRIRFRAERNVGLLLIEQRGVGAKKASRNVRKDKEKKP